MYRFFGNNIQALKSTCKESLNWTQIRYIPYIHIYKLIQHVLSQNIWMIFFYCNINSCQTYHLFSANQKRNNGEENNYKIIRRKPPANTAISNWHKTFMPIWSVFKTITEKRWRCPSQRFADHPPPLKNSRPKDLLSIRFRTF